MEYKILVADDDKEIREAIEIYLTNEQMKVLTACDGQEALKVLEAKSWYTPYYYGFNDA